jgi:hypothetical protein
VHGFEVDESVSFAVVGASRQDWRHNAGQKRRIHLAISINLHDHVRALLHGSCKAGNTGAADSLIVLVPQHDHSRVIALLRDKIPALVRASIIHAIDPVNLGTDSRQHLQNLGAHPVTRDHDRNARSPRVAGGCDSVLMGGTTHGARR